MEASVAISIPNEVVECQSPQLDTTKSTEIASQPEAEAKLVVGKKPKARRGKHKPTLVPRLLKLDANGEMILDDSVNSENAAAVDTSSVEVEESNTPSLVQIPTDKEQLAQLTASHDTEELAGVDENLNETSDVDNEMTFLNNLDLEKLVLVEATRDGADVFEIHEINPVTQEISEVPLDLPARYFDLIISVMTSQDEEE